MVTFAAYWPVHNNPKHTQRLGHIDNLRKIGIDVFFGDKTHGLDCAEVLLGDPPASKVPARLYSVRNCVLKFGLPVQPEVFQSLVKIWLSKVLLFQQAQAWAPTGTVFVWVDCVHRPNLELIGCDTSGRVSVNRYGGSGTLPMHENPFLGGCCTRHVGTIATFLSASVVKVPAGILDEFISAYREMWAWVDGEYSVYDEEIILSCMFQKSPEMFSVVN
jgi:hypothetical protein